MKTFFKMIFLLTIIIVKLNTCIADEKNTTTIAKCVYVNEKNKNQEFTLNISSDYVVTASGNALEDNFLKINKVILVSYEDFMDDNREFSCEKVPSLTLVKEVPQSAYDNVDYTIKNDNKSNFWKLDLNRSEVFVKNFDQEDNSESGWISTCHYGTYYLKFNKNSYETNVAKIVPEVLKHPTLTTHVSLYTDVMKFVTDNYFSCPAALCYEVIDYDMRYIQYKFSNEFGKDCIVSQKYTGKYTCGALELYMNNFETLTSDIVLNPTTQNIINLNNAMDNVIKFCRSVFSNLNYADSNNCIEECLEVVDIIQKYKNQNLGLGLCGFSGKLIRFIANIVKWVKYIIPVIVIVLGILDFIKAMVGDKDDEIKKAQGKFAKRLIAAALIFIIPFILEFVLNKMGFDANGCGIIDL